MERIWIFIGTDPVPELVIKSCVGIQLELEVANEDSLRLKYHK